MSEPTKQSRQTEIAIIGGGIIGSSIALRLAQAKAKVTLLDRGEFGAEASGAAAGMIAPQGEAIEPAAFAELCLKSRDLYPSFASEVEELSGESVGYRSDGALIVGASEAESKELDEIHHVQTRRGLALEKLSGDEARARVPGLAPEIRCGLFVAGDHWVDNERLDAGLVKACQRLGVTLSPHSEVTRFNTRGDRIESVEVRAEGASGTSTVSADKFVLAAGCWSPGLASPLGMELSMLPCRGQMIEFESAGELPHVVRAGHHYLVPRSRGRVVAGTTAEWTGFEKAVTGAGLHSILEGVSRIAPLVKGLRFLRAWSGLRPDTRDHMPVLGLGEPKNLIFATGHFRNGILLGPITAQLISELVLTGSSSLPLDLYRPSRLFTQAGSAASGKSR
jgi:glycine oxidase